MVKGISWEENRVANALVDKSHALLFKTKVSELYLDLFSVSEVE